LRIAIFCALALPTVSLAMEAKVLFGTGLSIDGITFSPRAFSSNWGGYSAMGKAEAAPGGAGGPPAISRDAGASNVLSRTFTLHTGPAGTPVFSGTGFFSETTDGGVRAEWRVTADKAGRFAEAFVGTDIPMSRLGGGIAIIDGVEVPIPANRGPKGHLFRNPTSSIELRGPDGATILRVALDEPTSTLVQDNRHWNGDGVGIRIYFATGSCEAGKEYAVKAKFLVAGRDGPALLESPLRLSAADPVRIVAGPDWIPLAREPWIEPESALDFSAMLPRHEPAGKFGRVIARGGHFEFEKLPGVPQRFYGVNICDTANLPETAEDAERIAANLARMGYNAVRIHHHERWLVREDGKLPEGAVQHDGTALQAGLIAKFDLLVAACVKHGLYLTTDLFVSRSHVISWRSLGIDRDGSVPTEKFKILCAFHEPAYSNLCAWTRNFLTHVNPHTGRSLAEEPALATLALVNEGNLGNWGATALRDLPCVEEAWRAWLAERNPADSQNNSSLVTRHSSLAGGIPDNLYSQPVATFLADAETRLYERLRDFVRDELHCPVPLSSISAWYEPAQYALPRSKFDYIDTHFYVDHPQFLDKSWRLPSRCPNRNPMRGSDRGAQDCVWIRQFDKPFCVSEFNFSGPGRYRGVGGIATGALAALQDWGGIWRFDWACTRAGITNPDAPMGYFDIANDPLSLAAERAALCLFLRGDLTPLEAEEPLVLDAATLRDSSKGAPRLASLGENAKAWSSRVGTRLAGAGKEPTSQNSSLVTRHSSLRDGSTVAIDSATGTFLLDTPRTCGGFAESGAHTAGPLRFEIAGRDGLALQDSPTNHLSLRGADPQTVAAATVWVSSLDGKPIAQSSHMLLTHLTDVQNNGIEYADPDLTILLKWGWLPHLMRRGAAEIELTITGRDGPAPQDKATHAWHVWRLSPGGHRVGEVPCAVSPSGGSRSLSESKGDGASTSTIAFTARTDYDPASATYLYEIVRE
jgi:hypothetical protein